MIKSIAYGTRRLLSNGTQRAGGNSARQRRTTRLKTLINRPQLSFIMEAHNALSARIVADSGFDGIWASGLSMSAALGVRDSNEASYSQILDVLEFMTDATDIPILLDGDTGYGNFNNARRLVHKLLDRSIAGVCFEDKLFPKTNSLLHGVAQPLADVNEFCLKIAACKDSQKDPDFQIIARVEALIAGHGVPDAVRRAEAYRLAGADAILIHSKQSDGKEITEFLKIWGARHPIILVPTNYATVPTDHWRNLGVNMIIWANHNLRASIAAQQSVCRHILENESVADIAPQCMVPVSEVFRLQNQHELTEAERKYLPDRP